MKKFLLLVAIVSVLLVGTFVMVKKQQHTVAHTIESSLSPDELWSQLLSTLSDSRQSNLWPNQLETISSQNVAERGTLLVERNTVFGKQELTHDITDLRYGIISFQSSSKNSVQSRQMISIIPRPTGSALSWSTTLIYPTRSLMGWYVQTRYLPLFFTELSEKIN